MKGKSTVTLRKSSNEETPLIGHLKSDYGMDRNYLKGRNEAEINVLMASCAYNLKNILNHLRIFIQNCLKAWIPVFWDINDGILRLSFIFEEMMGFSAATILNGD